MEYNNIVLAVRVILLIVIIGLLTGYLVLSFDGMKDSYGYGHAYPRYKYGFLGSPKGPNVWEVGEETRHAERNVHKDWLESRVNDM